MPVKIAAASYLNSLPLTYSLQSCKDIEYHDVSPYDAARGVMEGTYDVGLIPLASYAQDGRLRILPEFCIASNGAVDSVCLVSNVSPEKWNILWLDMASRSSALLANIYFSELSLSVEKYRVASAKIVSSIQNTENSVGLLIGDLALKHSGEFQYKIDLGEFYTNTYSKPFLYAVWAGFPEKLTPEVQELIKTAAKDIENKKYIAEKWANENNTDVDTCFSYLVDKIHFHLDEDVIAGGNKYLEMLFDKNIIPNTKIKILDDKLPDEKLSVKRSIDSILSDGANGIRLSATDGIRLFEAGNLEEIGHAAHQRRLQLTSPKIVTYIIERNINYTNICNVYCRFCGFYRRPGHEEGYILSRDEIASKMKILEQAGGTQVLLQGGVHPDLKIKWYEDLFCWLRKSFPKIRLHALSPDEITYIAEVSNLSLYDTIFRLKEAGLASVPGAGAEILVDSVRRRIARLKSESERWLDVMRQAHRCGLRSSATMMFGVRESFNDRMQHFLKLRELQDETQGFTAFICWPYQEFGNLEKGNTGVDAYLRTQAISRLMLDNISNIQSSWVTMGPDVGQRALRFGANDFGSVMFEENVVSAAGTIFSIDAKQIEDKITAAGFTPALRDPLYQPIFNTQLENVI